MTEREFLSAVKRMKTTWKINKNGFIRAQGGRCPVEVVANLPSELFFMAEDALHMRRSLLDSLVHAADGRNLTKHNVDLRRRLLKACGLTEPA